jgi:hypothetical protein
VSSLGARVRGDPVTDEHKVQLHVSPNGRRGFFPFSRATDCRSSWQVKFETDADDMTALLGAEQVAGATQFEIAHRDAEARPSWLCWRIAAKR